MRPSDLSLKRVSPLPAFLLAFLLGWVGGCQCTGTGYEQLRYACATDRDCIDGWVCVGGYCETSAGADGGCGDEVCDNDVDENCNGVLDDGCPCTSGGRACYTGGLGSLELHHAWDGGAGCAAGVQACAGGVWADTCQGERGPQPEFCDGLDTDCDGLPDPVSCPCQQGKRCYQGLPHTIGADPGGLTACKAGTWDCTRPAGAQCVGQVLPAAREQCDGLDDDCNGQVDDQADTAACGPGICSDAPRACVDGGQPACDLTTIAGYSPAEVCGDGLDNDCDGLVEELCSCVLDAGISCWTGTALECPTDGGPCLGICRRGTQRCVSQPDGGTGYSSCSGAVSAQTENCSNTQDDDCDGLTDCADPSCSGRSCSTTGSVCTGGTCQCAVPDGGTVQASENICNDGRDNDCDGLPDCADPGCASRTCATGKVCSGSSCVSADGGTPQAIESICNDGFDNDGDGFTDCADLGCDDRTCAPNGFECISQTCQCGGGGTPQAVETNCADGRDNDCDTFIDCADPSCIGDAGVCLAELNCSDGVDNDLDGRTDCADTNCIHRRCNNAAPGAVCCGPWPAQPNTATCVNLSNDPNNCGGCGTVCGSGQCLPRSGSGHTSGVCACDAGVGCPRPPAAEDNQSCNNFQCDCGGEENRCNSQNGQSGKCQQLSGADVCYYENGGN